MSLFLIISVSSILLIPITCIKKYSENNIMNKVRDFFVYSAFIRFWISIYLDINIFSILRLGNVIFRKMRESVSIEIIDNIMSFIFSVRLI